MNESADLLRLRVLLCFLRSTPENCNVTGISRTLREEKYTISRMMAHLENEAVILRALAEERTCRTVVLVSHRASTMRIADTVYSVESGRLS